MRIYKIIKNTTVEGPGNRFCIWFQGCSKHCKGCFATETWDYDAGKEYSQKELIEMITSQKDIEGVTFLGGEPFDQSTDLSRPWVGSSNQRYIYLSERYCEQEIMKYKNKIEVHINYDGEMEINGMGDFSKLENDFCLQLAQNNVK